MYLDSNQTQSYHLIEQMQRQQETNERLDIVRKIGARLVEDGNQWCWIYGEMPVNYLAGFGDTPALAANDFWMNYHNQKISKP